MTQEKNRGPHMVTKNTIIQAIFSLKQHAITVQELIKTARDTQGGIDGIKKEAWLDWLNKFTENPSQDTNT